MATTRPVRYSERVESQAAAELAARLAEATKSFPAGEHRVEAVSARSLMGTHLPVVKLRRGDETLSFIVAPTDPAARVYKRTKSFDVTYFSEDVPDDEQSRIYQRDRAAIDRFVAWLVAWDA